jgi:hypothetical protein
MQVDGGYVTRRIVAAPVDYAFLRRGDPPSHGALPPIFTLGRARDGDAILFLRFSVPLPPDATVVEAYLLLTRSDELDVDPTPISLHATKIIDPWSGGSISWASQPRLEEVRAPSTAVNPASPSLVRLDVRDLVLHWRSHEKNDQGIAVVAENSTAAGTTFAMFPSGAVGHAESSPSGVSVGGTAVVGLAAAAESRGAAAPVAGGAEGAAVAPRLELYVR